MCGWKLYTKLFDLLLLFDEDPQPVCDATNMRATTDKIKDITFF